MARYIIPITDEAMGGTLSKKGPGEPFLGSAQRHTTVLHEHLATRLLQSTFSLY